MVESTFPFASSDTTVISPVGVALPPTNRLSRTSAVASVAPDPSTTATEATPSAANPAKRPPTQETLTGSSGDGKAPSQPASEAARCTPVGIEASVTAKQN